MTEQRLKVKQLEWTRNGRDSLAYTPLGLFCVFPSSPAPMHWTAVGPSRQKILSGKCTQKQAKAACQQHFNDLVLSLIDTGDSHE